MTKEIDITNLIQEYELANSPILKFFILAPFPLPDGFLDFLSKILGARIAKKIKRLEKFRKMRGCND